MPPVRKLATALILTFALGAAPALAAPNDGHDPSVDQDTVCTAILQSCNAACEAEPSTDAVLDPYQVCKAQCSLAYRQCMKGLLRTVINQSIRTLINPAILGLDGTPSTGGSGPAGDTSRPPADPSDGKGDGGGFDPGSTTGGGTPVFSAD